MREPDTSPPGAGSPYVPARDLALLADKAFDMLCIAADGRLVAVNHAFERVLGWTAAELTSRPFLDFVHPDDRAATSNVWLKMLDGADVVDFENRYHHRDGSWRRVQWRAGPLDNGRFHGVARDVTVLARERTLIERTHRIARVGGWQLDRRSQQLYWTSGTFRLHDLDPQAFVPTLERALDFYLPRDRPRMAAAVERLLTEGDAFDLETQLMTAKGRQITVRAEGIPIIEGGEVVGAYGAIGDITRRRDAERQLRRMEAVVHASPNAALFFSPTRRLQWFNPAAQALLGLDRSHLGAPSAHYFSASAAARFEQIIQPALLARGSWQGLLDARDARGEVVPVRVTVVLHRDAAGQPDFFSCSLEDQRRERLLQQQVRHSQRLEGVGRLAGGLAHDFNNLLTVVMANGDELADALGGTPLEPLAQEILEAAQRGAALTKRILAYARQDVARPESIDLLAVCLDLTRILQRTLGEQIRVRIDPGPDNWPVFIDRTHLDQLLMNLAVNARDAMPEGGELSFTLRALPGNGSVPPRMELVVSDTGHGMPADVAARAFDPFFTTKDRDRGTGLGLATCLGIVQQADGEISIDSVEGVGTRVIVHLPRAPRQPEMSSKAPPQLRPAAADGVRLVVIEDEAAIRRALTKGLREAGYAVQAFATGEDALDAVRSGRSQPQVIISDVILPGMDGPTAVRRIRGMLGPLPVIFASGYATEKLTSVDLQAPATRLISKPYTPRGLDPLIRELLA